MVLMVWDDSEHRADEKMACIIDRWDAGCNLGHSGILPYLATSGGDAEAHGIMLSREPKS